jgi:sugar phosphate isomerase/epimerase
VALVTRREFTSGLAVAVAAVAARGAADGQPKPSVFGGIQVGVQSYTFRAFDVDRMIAAMTSVGLTSVELWNGHLDPIKASEAEFKSVRGKLDAAGIKVSAYCANFPTDATDDHLDRAFRGAGLLGTDVMTSSLEKPILDRVDERCRRYKIRLGLHNHYLGDSWFKGDKAANFEGPDDFLKALEGRSEYLAINLDVGHFYAAGHDPVAFFRDHHRRIVSLHIKDRDRDAERTYRRFGEGQTPIAEVLRLAGMFKFPYAANIEYELEEKDPTEGVRRSFDYIKRVLAPA